jgi:large subunit ribosomal protein L22
MAEEKKVAKKPAAAKKTTAKKATKPAKTVKPVKKVEEKPAKVMPTEAKAIALNVRITPRKARLVMDAVRGMSVEDANNFLKNLRKAAATPVLKVINSAAANATNNFGMDAKKLYVATIFATDGLKMKRYLPRAKGSASGLVKRTAHLTAVVKER